MNLIQKVAVFMAVTGLAFLALSIFMGKFEWLDLLSLFRDFILFWLIYHLAGKADE